jgi:hypothetical protein
MVISSLHYMQNIIKSFVIFTTIIFKITIEKIFFLYFNKKINNFTYNFELYISSDF